MSDALGLPAFPIGLGDLDASLGETSRSSLGQHVMGAVVLAWITEFPLRQWGENWATSGSMDARFRAHLEAGIPMTAAIHRFDDRLAVAIVDAEERRYATAEVSSPTSNDCQPHSPNHEPTSAPPSAPTSATAPTTALSSEPSGSSAPAGPDAPAELTPESLRDRILRPLTFDFVARRDLAFTQRMADGAFWREREWAHPAWLASASNAVVRHNVAFPPPGHWVNAGLAIDNHAPIPDGSTITMNGRVESLFDGRNFRFATAVLGAFVAGHHVATLRNTFAYAPLAPLAPSGPGGRVASATNSP